MKAQFAPGRLLATEGALKAMQASGQSPFYFLARHVIGDWGEISKEDKMLNDHALTTGARILSAYNTLKGVKLWVITEAVDDEGWRRATTILRPDEY